jgi:hypothetical protein
MQKPIVEFADGVDMFVRAGLRGRTGRDRRELELRKLRMFNDQKTFCTSSIENASSGT